MGSLYYPLYNPSKEFFRPWLLWEADGFWKASVSMLDVCLAWPKGHHILGMRSWESTNFKSRSYTGNFNTICHVHAKRIVSARMAPLFKWHHAEVQNHVALCKKALHLSQNTTRPILPKNPFAKLAEPFMLPKLAQSLHTPQMTWEVSQNNGTVGDLGDMSGLRRNHGVSH